MPEDERERRVRLWQKAVTKSLDWVDDDVTALSATESRRLARYLSSRDRRRSARTLPPV